jgi:PAS domain S-box-containing protein
MEGKITRWNQKFVDLWKVPQHLLDTTVKNPLLAYATSQMVNPKKFLTEAKELHDNPDKTTADTLNLADGRIFNFYSQPQKIGSEIVGRFWEFRDITDSKRSEAILRSSETKFRSIVETSQDWIWEMDLSGKHTFSNARVSDILGYSLDYFLSMDINKLVHQEDSQAIIARLPQHILDKCGWRGWVLRWRHKDGSYKFLESNANPIFNELGELVGFRGVDRDITERKKAEEALQESEKRFRSYIINSPHAIFVSNENGRYLEVNPAASSITGYSAEELLKMGVMDLLPPDSFEWGANNFKQLVETGYSSGEAAYRRKSGEIGFWSLAAVKISPDRFIGFVTDITERKQFEDALAGSERFLKTIIDTEPECIKMLDSDCKVLMMNPAGLEMIQADSLEQVKGQCVCPLIIPAYRDAFATLTKQVFQGHSGVLEFETIGLKGRHIWLETHAVPFRNEHDEIVSLLGITRDVTERKEANEKIKNLNEHLEKMVEDRTQELAHANRDLNSLCYTISHELMAPVTRLKNFGQILQEQLHGNPGEALHCAERITAASEKLQHVIDSVLQLARLSQIPFDPVPQNLSNIARMIVDELMKGIPARHVEVTVADGITATCDPQMVRICLSSLFENALKFSVRQTTAQIEFGYDTVHDALFVRDNGVGFDMSQADRLFEPFIRMHREDEFAGSGIGLATVRRIVERHGGRIWAEAEQGKGATFYFTLTGG